MEVALLRRIKNVLVLVALLCLASCGTSPAGRDNTDSRLLVDALGRPVRVKTRVKRIVSLAPNLTEIVFALGAGDRLVANTTYCDYPPEAKDVEHVGTTLKPDLERVVALKPDVVLVSRASQLEETTQRLDSVGIPTFVTSEEGLEELLATIYRVADLIGVPDQGRDLGGSLRSRAEAVARAVAGRPAPSVFVMVGDRPLITTGGKTFINDLVERAGGRSISAEETSDWPQYSAETVVAKAPEVILVPGAAHGAAGSIAELPEILKETPAAKSGRVVNVDGDLIMRPGPRLLDGLEQLARALHPEAFT